MRTKNLKRVIAVFAAAVLVLTSQAATVFAADSGQNIETTEVAVVDVMTDGDIGPIEVLETVDGGTRTVTYIISNGGFSWDQRTTSAMIFPEFSCSSATNINIYLELVAKSLNAGTFHAKLQKKGAFGVWSTTGNVYTLSQNNGTSWSTRANAYVNGQFAQVMWNTNSGGNYRVVLEDATNAQSTSISSVYVWKNQ